MTQEELFILGTAPKSGGGEYITTTFKWKAPNTTIALRIQEDQYHLSLEEAEKYMKAVIECLNKLVVKCENSSFDPYQIIALNLATIDSWLSGIAVISKYSMNDLVDLIYDRVEHRHKKDTQELQSILEKKNREALNWKEEERLIELNNILQYELTPEVLQTTTDKTFNAMNKILSKIKSELKSENKLKNIHPGEVLNEEFLKPMEISIQTLSDETQLSEDLINKLIAEEAKIDENVARKLSEIFKNSKEFWLGLQRSFDAEEKGI